MFGQQFNFGSLASAAAAIANFLVIAGGGSGGSSLGGGGGAGGPSSAVGVDEADPSAKVAQRSEILRPPQPVAARQTY